MEIVRNKIQQTECGMKIVINTCFGGFGLSCKAEDLYAENKGLTLYRYKQTKYAYKDGVSVYEKVGPEEANFFVYTFSEDHGQMIEGYPSDGTHWSSSDLDRDDPILIKVLEELGEEANGDFAALKIVDIPEGVEWMIEEHDGNEHIAECHSTWS
jgi:hypothetical protein